ncbi:carbohydrate ABC transporter permease [Thermasporomyces composti]|jgi:multiple sugar transport system permease protein|uniref:Carbohydrate ABC transporter membrane protein 1 (CUT1 family) n=1 Tax=Thermasporomyces composti TaxID=696763 RepID=A0A3D9V625_THECX|nr:sugar ABC transporter permease [Thermasporomyces composti]REF37218.1 carbohydrate ABC transporter membrane protein 1 (CUT1 family) [Thermasporomyces composti]
MAAQEVVAQQQSATVPVTGSVRRRVPTGLWFILPFFVLYVAFLIVPVFLGLGISFFNTSLSGGLGEFVGFANYAELFADEAVWDSLWNTVKFTLLSTPPLVVLALVMALLTNNAMPARWLLRLSYFMPFLVPVTVVTTVWSWMFRTDFGFVNGMLEAIGLEKVDWLGQPGTAMISIVITTTWWTIGFNYLLYLAGLQQIPPELYEASAIDGANAWKQFTNITLPLLGRVTGLILVLQLIASLKVFDQIYLLTGGGPNFSTRPILEYVYDMGFTGFRLGYASAISYVFFLIILVFAFIQVRLFSSKEGSGR